MDLYVLASGHTFFR